MGVGKDTRSMPMMMKGYREYADDDEGGRGSCQEGNGDYFPYLLEFALCKSPVWFRIKSQSYTVVTLQDRV